jgi:hypothetical protein
MTWLVRGLDVAARWLPPERRQWVEALQAEGGQVPPGWPRLGWLAGGVLIIAREAGMARKIGYWAGSAAVAVALTWVVWLSWHAVDPEAATDRARILAGAVALVGLPWVARRSGLFGPAGTGVVARLVRVAGCAAVCALGLGLVRVDRHSGINSVLGSGKFSWVPEACGLIILLAGLAAPLIIRARRPQTERAVLWVIVACAAVTAMVIVPIQTLVVGYVAVIFAATSRRSPVAPPTLTVGVVVGLPAAAIVGALLFVLDNFFLLLLIAVVAILVISCFAGAGAARLVSGNTDELRATRIRQGALAGAIAGAVGGLVPSAIFLIFGAMMILGPLAGIVGGTLGGALAADHLIKLRPARTVATGVSVPET